MIGRRAAWAALAAIVVAFLALNAVIVARSPVVYWWDAHVRLAAADRILLGRWLPLLQVLLYALARFDAPLVVTRAALAGVAAVAVVAIYACAAAWAGRAVGLVAALLLAANSLFITLAAVPYQEPLFLACVFAGLALWAGPSPRHRLAGGLFIGLACLTRYEGWLLPPILLAGSLPLWGRVRERVFGRAKNPLPGGEGAENPLPNPLPRGEGAENPLPNPLPGGEGVGNPLPNPLPRGEGAENPLPNPLPGGEGAVNPLPNPLPGGEGVGLLLLLLAGAVLLGAIVMGGGGGLSVTGLPAAVAEYAAGFRRAATLPVMALGALGLVVAWRGRPAAGYTGWGTALLVLLAVLGNLAAGLFSPGNVRRPFLGVAFLLPFAALAWVWCVAWARGRPAGAGGRRAVAVVAVALTLLWAGVLARRGLAGAAAAAALPEFVAGHAAGRALAAGDLPCEAVAVVDPDPGFRYVVAVYAGRPVDSLLPAATADDLPAAPRPLCVVTRDGITVKDEG